MMQRRRRKASRKAGLVATLSARALIIFVPAARSFDHEGTRPQRRIAISRFPAPSLRTTGASCVGAMLNRLRIRSSGGTRKVYAIMLPSASRK
jgi:hypothetical protein